MKQLDLGCGLAKVPGAIGIDIIPHRGVDLVHDLNIVPWPVETGAYDLIHCRHIVEHVAVLASFLQEIHRAGRPGARVEIVTPHFSNRCSYADPTHLRHLSLRSFDFFTQGFPAESPAWWERALETRQTFGDGTFPVHFRRRRIFLSFGRPFRRLGIQWLANRWPDLYECYLAFLFPARDIHVTLEVQK